MGSLSSKQIEQEKVNILRIKKSLKETLNIF